MRSGTLNAKGHSAEFQFLPNESCRFRMADAFRNAWDPGPMARGIQNGRAISKWFMHSWMSLSISWMGLSISWIGPSKLGGVRGGWCVCILRVLVGICR